MLYAIYIPTISILPSSSPAVGGKRITYREAKAKTGGEAC
jgi:hypothetical protein